MSERPTLKLPLYIEDIQRSLPHRFPFLLIDRVLELAPGQSIKCLKNLSVSDPVFQGHFPEDPVYPGVLILESMAQAASVLAHYTLDYKAEHVLLTEISSSRFRRKVVPGDQLVIEATVAKSRAPFFWFETNAYVDGELAAKATMSASVK